MEEAENRKVEECPFYLICTLPSSPHWLHSRSKLEATNISPNSSNKWLNIRSGGEDEDEFKWIKSIGLWIL